jgi:hypothetical protein
MFTESPTTVDYLIPSSPDICLSYDIISMVPKKNRIYIRTFAHLEHNLMLEYLINQSLFIIFVAILSYHITFFCDIFLPEDYIMEI